MNKSISINDVTAVWPRMLDHQFLTPPDQTLRNLSPKFRKPNWLHTQVPDVDAVIHFADLPVADLAAVPDSPPLFSYGSSAAFAEIPFPDFTFWGNTGPSQQRTWQVKPATHEANMAFEVSGPLLKQCTVSAF